MIVRTMLDFSADEISRNINYPLICEARFGRAWGTASRRRRWLTEFSARERDKADDLFVLAHRWFLVTGVPETVRMTADTLMLWQKLESFCGSLS